MSSPEIIVEFADRVEALAQGLGLTLAEFIYVLEALKVKRLNECINSKKVAS